MGGLRRAAVGLILGLATAASLSEVAAQGRRMPEPAANRASLALADPLRPPAPRLAAQTAAGQSGAPLGKAWLPDSRAAVPAAPPAPSAGPVALPWPAPVSPVPADAAGLQRFADDPLPSWRAGSAKAALLRFVRQAIRPDGPGFIPPGERLAVFDNDGTLWSEQPLYFPFQFCVDRLRSLASAPPAWRRQEPHASALHGDVEALLSQGTAALAALLPACSAGMDRDTYAAEVRRWLATARHPRTGLPYTAMVFQPMLELLQWLRSAGFRSVIVSGGDSEFMRPWTEAVYGIPPEQVIGTRLALAWQQAPGQPPRLLRQPALELVVDGANKPIAIQQTLGRRPVAAFGNSDGDLQMLEWTTAGAGPRLALLVHHTDARREWAYDRDSRVGRLDRALDLARQRGWIVVDMARDWLRVYPHQPRSR